MRLRKGEGAKRLKPEGLEDTSLSEFCCFVLSPLTSYGFSRHEYTSPTRLYPRDGLLFTFRLLLSQL